MAKLTAEEREARKQARRAADAARWEQERRDRDIIADALRTVIIDDTATPAQRLYAVACLDHLKSYHIIPYSMRYPDSREDADFTRLRADFATALKATEENGAKQESN